MSFAVRFAIASSRSKMATARLLGERVRNRPPDVGRAARLRQPPIQTQIHDSPSALDELAGVGQELVDGRVIVHDAGSIFRTPRPALLPEARFCCTCSCNGKSSALVTPRRTSRFFTKYAAPCRRPARMAQRCS